MTEGRHAPMKPPKTSKAQGEKWWRRTLSSGHFQPYSDIKSKDRISMHVSAGDSVEGSVKALVKDLRRDQDVDSEDH
jgi:hypothetical protein